MSDSSARMVNCEVELSEFKIEYAQMMAIKEQTLTDFIMDNTRNNLVNMIEMRTSTRLKERHPSRNSTVLDTHPKNDRE